MWNEWEAENQNECCFYEGRCFTPFEKQVTPVKGDEIRMLY